MFKDKEDLFDRKPNPENPPLLESVNRLRIKLELTDGVFNGGTLYLRTTPGRNIGFPLNGSTLDLPFSLEDMEYINKTIPYMPEMGIEFPKGKTLTIPPNLGVKKLEFSADFQHTIKF
jgi:hypothetical protein